MNEELIKFIELCLIDGVITDTERKVIFKKAKALGVDEDECEIILEAYIQKSQSKNDQKKIETKKERTVSVEEDFILNVDDLRLNVDDDLLNRIEEKNGQFSTNSTYVNHLNKGKVGQKFTTHLHFNYDSTDAVFWHDYMSYDFEILEIKEDNFRDYDEITIDISTFARWKRQGLYKNANYLPDLPIPLFASEYENANAQIYCSEQKGFLSTNYNAEYLRYILKNERKTSLISSDLKKIIVAKRITKDYNKSKECYQYCLIYIYEKYFKVVLVNQDNTDKQSHSIPFISSSGQNVKSPVNLSNFSTSEEYCSAGAYGDINTFILKIGETIGTQNVMHHERSYAISCGAILTRFAIDFEGFQNIGESIVNDEKELLQKLKTDLDNLFKSISLVINKLQNKYTNTDFECVEAKNDVPNLFRVAKNIQKELRVGYYEDLKNLIDLDYEKSIGKLVHSDSRTYKYLPFTPFLRISHRSSIELIFNKIQEIFFILSIVNEILTKYKDSNQEYLIYKTDLEDLEIFYTSYETKTLEEFRNINANIMHISHTLMATNSLLKQAIGRLDEISHELKFGALVSLTKQIEKNTGTTAFWTFINAIQHYKTNKLLKK